MRRRWRARARQGGARSASASRVKTTTGSSPPLTTGVTMPPLRRILHPSWSIGRPASRLGEGHDPRRRRRGHGKEDQEEEEGGAFARLVHPTR